MSQNKDSLGERIKSYEYQYTSDRLMPMVPWIARLDGKAFHTFTKGLDRPFCKPFRNLMVDVTKYLVEETSAKVGYTQSDEITLCWNNKDYKNEGLFKGKVHKLNSVLASMCTLAFNRFLPQYLSNEYTKKSGIFDCRVFAVPTEMEAYNVFLWRELDAARNSVQMAGQSEFSHTELQNKDQNKIKEMLIKERNIDWEKYPDWAKYGCFVRRKKRLVQFSLTEIEKLPANHQARKDGNLLVRRSVLEVGSSESFGLQAIENPIEWLFGE